MKTRIIAGICMIPLLLLVYLGGFVFFATVFLIAMIGIVEFYDGFKNMGVKPSYVIGLSSVFLLFLTNLWQNFFANPQGMVICWLVLTIFACLIYSLNVKKRKIEDGMATLVGVLYVGLFSIHLVLIEQSLCSILIWIVLIISFGTDVGAYFSGYFFGKKKLCPDLSPKKTIAGAIGGTVASIILSGLFGYFFANDLFIHCLILGAIGSVFAQLGDLVASAFKRKMGIKDYGNLIPGHGGILDRFDSVIMVAPFVYYYIYFIILV